MRIKVSHTTNYHFEVPLTYGVQKVRLSPKDRPDHKVLSWEIKFEGGASEGSFWDHNNNYTHLVRVDKDVQDLSIQSMGVVETENNNGIWGQHLGFLPLWHFRRQTALTEPGKVLKRLAKSVSFTPEKTLESLHHLSATILDQIPYRTGETHVGNSAEDAAELGLGVCQDHSHIFISCARQWGVPARYISGYLFMPESTDQSASHAWAEAWIEGLGWTGFDVSNGISPDEKYVRIASGLDYSEASPIAGVVRGGSQSSLSVQLSVQQ